MTIDRDTADRIFGELAALRDSVSDVHAVAVRVDERMHGFATHHEERARKHSDAVAAIDVRVKAVEIWRWVLVGAWLAVPVCWAVFVYVKGGKS